MAESILDHDEELGYYRKAVEKAPALDCKKQRQGVYRAVDKVLIKFAKNYAEDERPYNVMHLLNRTHLLLKDIAATDDESDAIQEKLTSIDDWKNDYKAGIANQVLMRSYALNTEYIASALKLIALTQLLNELKDKRLFAARKKLHQALCALHSRLFPAGRTAIANAAKIFDLSVGVVMALETGDSQNLDRQIEMLQKYVAEVPHASSTYVRRILVALVVAALSFLLMTALQMHFSGIGLVAALSLVKLTAAGLPQILAIVNAAAPPVLGLLSLAIPFSCRYYSDKIPRFTTAVNFFEQKVTELTEKSKEGPAYSQPTSYVV